MALFMSSLPLKALLQTGHIHSFIPFILLNHFPDDIASKAVWGSVFPVVYSVSGPLTCWSVEAQSHLTLLCTNKHVFCLLFACLSGFLPGLRFPPKVQQHVCSGRSKILKCSICENGVCVLWWTCYLDIVYSLPSLFELCRLAPAEPCNISG